LQEWPSSITKLMAAEMESAVKAAESPEMPQQKAAIPPP
jgi:hypothetical protein